VYTIYIMKKELTTKQQTFLDNLVETGGDPKEAARLAGYSENGHWQVAQALKNEIIELASNILAQSAPKAAMKLVDIMDSNVPIPQANMRLQAAQTILDRTGLGKQERLDVQHKITGGLFILPAKEEIIINGNATEIE
jgi:phage terminase small subunit